MEENQCRICLQQLEENAGKNIFKTRVNGEKPLCDYFQLLFDFKVTIGGKFLLSTRVYLSNLTNLRCIPTTTYQI